MQKPFVSHPALFATSADLEHPSLQGWMELRRCWTALEQIMAGIYASKTGRPGYSVYTGGDEAALCADAAYSSKETRGWLESFGIKDRVQRKGYRGHPVSDAGKARNAEIATTRSGGERPFASYKSRYGLARTRLTGWQNRNSQNECA